MTGHFIHLGETPHFSWGDGPKFGPRFRLVNEPRSSVPLEHCGELNSKLRHETDQRVVVS